VVGRRCGVDVTGRRARRPIRVPSSGGRVRPSVGLWPVGLRLEVPDAVAGEQLAQRAVLDVAEAVVGHQPLGGDAVLAEEGERSFDERCHGLGFFVVVDLDVGEPGVVVDDGARVNVSEEIRAHSRSLLTAANNSGRSRRVLSKHWKSPQLRNPEVGFSTVALRAFCCGRPGRGDGNRRPFRCEGLFYSYKRERPMALAHPLSCAGGAPRAA
jgi:hypothetical protein